jgi:hypothetical protein
MTRAFRAELLLGRIAFSAGAATGSPRRGAVRTQPCRLDLRRLPGGADVGRGTSASPEWGIAGVDGS